MPRAARFLHITDTHLKPSGSKDPRDDRKKETHLELQTREIEIRDTLQRLLEDLNDGDRDLDAVIFTGDALSAGVEGGDELLLNMLLEYLRPRGITKDNIVAVPGNHDIPRGTLPDSRERYENFVKVWRGAGCITPWLDGYDSDAGVPDFSKHILMPKDGSWAIIACNSCNWSHVDAIPEGLRSIWNEIPTILAEAKKDSKLADAYRKELNDLARYDMARVSPKQMEKLRLMLKSLKKPESGRQVRLLALHHHLRSPSHDEEIKPFADITNLEQVRTFVAQQDIRVLLHGHKHKGRLHFDLIEQDDAEPHRAVMISGSSFGRGEYSDAMRLVDIDGLPWAPTLTLEPQAVPRGGILTRSDRSAPTRLWSKADSEIDATPVIQGEDFNEVYARVKHIAANEAKGKPLIVQLDVKEPATIQCLPEDYPDKPGTMEARQKWLGELVAWWQLPHSQLQGRIPFIHGPRLRRYASYFDQIDRVKTLLAEKETTRAVAVLVDPAADFKDDKDNKVEFASFCLVQFLKRPLPDGTHALDCIAYYRVQEMIKWWPINVAELLNMQLQVVKGFKGKPGRITTITASARAIAKQPTHVAMPSIDRWLDQYPEKYFVLAAALLSGDASSNPAAEITKEWLEALESLKAAALDIHPEGNPVVAIDGPHRLSQYLLNGSGANLPAAKVLAKLLDEIARKGSEAAPPPGESRDDWGKRLAELLAAAIEQTTKLVAPKQPADGATP